MFIYLQLSNYYNKEMRIKILCFIENFCVSLILFGDKQAYLEKFKTRCRTRPFHMQKLDAKF